MPALHANPEHQPLLRELGLDFDTLFTDPCLSIRERENCTLDATLSNGQTVRIHVKRRRADARAAEVEARAIQLLESACIPTTPIIAHGHDTTRSVLVTADLTGFEDAEQ